MLITIENHDERVTIDTAAPHQALSASAPSGSASQPGSPSGPGPADLDAGPAGFDPAGNRSAAAAAGVPLAVAGAEPTGGGVLDGGAYGT